MNIHDTAKIHGDERLDVAAEEGAAAVEYAMAASLVAMVSIAVFKLLGTQLGEVFTAIADSIAG